MSKHLKMFEYSLIARFYYFFFILMWINYPGSFENKLKEALNNNYTEIAHKITEEKYMVTSNKLSILLSYVSDFMIISNRLRDENIVEYIYMKNKTE